YACVRIGAILEKAAAQNLAPGNLVLSEPAERQLALECLRFPEAMKAALQTMQPSIIAEYAFVLAQAFSRFYTDCPVLKLEDTQTVASRLTLCRYAHKVLTSAMALLG